jgi:hypothetical protein
VHSALRLQARGNYSRGVEMHATAVAYVQLVSTAHRLGGLHACISHIIHGRGLEGWMTNALSQPGLT